MKKCLFAILGLVAALLVTVQATSARASLIFSPITTNSPVLPSGQVYADLFDATSAGVPKAKFVFNNNVGTASAVTDIFVDNAGAVLKSLLSVTGMDSDPGNDVNFVSGNSNPPVLPGFNNASPPFSATTALGAEASHSGGGDIDNSLNDAGDSVELVYDLTAGKTYADVLTALTNGSLRFGLHIQAIAGGTSDSYVNLPVPEPSILILLGMSSLGLLACGRKRK